MDYIIDSIYIQYIFNLIQSYLILFLFTYLINHKITRLLIISIVILLLLIIYNAFPRSLTEPPCCVLR